jgi:cyclohexa-1,5-dienecarbonyl-CoA hydratase
MTAAPLPASLTAGDGPVRLEVHVGGALWRMLLARPKANVIDGAMTAALTAAFGALRDHPEVKAVVLEGMGPHFSFGASVEEHTTDKVSAMLAGFHGLFRTILASAVPLIAAVRGQCLGGGLELAAFAHRVFAAPDSKLGQPEIRLGVFAPVASLVLPERMGRGAAESLLLSGAVLDGEAALRLRLVDELAADPWAAAAAWFGQHLLPHSASSLRFASKAARLGYGRRFTAELAAVEQLYREELEPTYDAREGIAAFLQRRTPLWRNQ